MQHGVVHDVSSGEALPVQGVNSFGMKDASAAATWSSYWFAHALLLQGESLQPEVRPLTFINFEFLKDYFNFC